MIDANFYAVVDISSIIWDKNDFNVNKYDYYNLISEVSNLFEKTKNLGINILIRDELLEQMIDGFPFDEMPGKYYEFGNIVYTFLANVGSKYITYSNDILGGLNSIPNIIKSHYNEITKDEIGYLISKIHSNEETGSVYFTFRYLWTGNEKLRTETEDKINTYETVISDNGTDLDDFFEKFILCFEHKEPKHNCSIHKNRDAWNRSDEKGTFESQLSCFCGKNKKIVQDILDKRYNKCFGNEFYYSYDDDNKVYVVFRKTLNNVYHAYDMYDIDNVPQEVKKQFNIWKY